MKYELESDRLLLCYLRGELSGVQLAELERRLQTEPELRQRYQDLEMIWVDLELPPAEPADGSFLREVMARVHAEDASPVATTFTSPRWASAAAAMALVAGIALGAGLGLDRPVEAAEVESLDSPEPLSLAEDYWLNLDQMLDEESAAEGSEERS